MNRRNINILTVTFTLTVLSACSVGKKYTRSELGMPENFREQVSVTADTVLLPWKTFFKEPQLVALIEKALDKNNDVAIAIMNMQQTELSYKQAKLQLLPTVDFTAAGTRNWLSKNSLNGSLSQQFTNSPYMDEYNAALNVSWEADIWGKAKMQKQEAMSGFFMQKENLQALRTRIISQVAQAYYNLIALDEQFNVAQRNVELSDSTLKMTKLQYRSAQVTSVAVEQTESQKKTAELLVPLIKQNIAVQENALSILCGSYPTSVERAKGLDLAMPEYSFSAGVPATLLSRRPDIKAAEYAVMIANAKTGLAKANMYPAFSLTASVGANSFKFNNWFDLPGSLVKNLGTNLTQPVFRKKSLKTAYDIALIEQEKSVKQFKQSVLVAVGEVSDALITIKHTDERLMLIEQKNQSLAKATNDAMLLYKSALTNYLEVITAQNNALQNELDAIVIKRDKLIALTNLYRSLGGGVE